MLNKIKSLLTTPKAQSEAPQTKLFGFITGLECDHYDNTTIEVQPGMWTAAGRVEIPRIMNKVLHVKYPDNVIGPTGDGWYRLYLVAENILILNKDTSYTPEVGQGREQRKLPIVFYVHNGNIIQWQQYQRDIYWTAASIARNQDIYTVTIDATTAPKSGDIQLKMIPEESRLAHILVMAQSPLAHCGNLITPGVTSDMPIPNGITYLSMITNSTQHIRYSLFKGTKISIVTRGWQWREPIH